MKNRLLVLTDITSLAAGVREPDDGQSLIRLLLYANQLDIEGLVAASNLGHGQTTRPALIHQAIEAYAKVRPNLLAHDAAYPEAGALAACVHAGQPLAGPQVPVTESIGDNKDTDASRFIISLVDKADPRPLWVAVWGGTADLAQALWRTRQTRTTPQLAAFVAKLRVHAIGDQDSTGVWIKANFPDLFYITRRYGIRGMYRGGDESLVSSAWVRANVLGHGALGDLYPDYHGGDIWGRVHGIKEGDTPSFLGLIPNGLGDPSIEGWQPNWGGWGGRFQKSDASGLRWEDATDKWPGMERDRDPRMATVYRWRPAWQADFAARLDWCAQAPRTANHPPLAHIEGPLRRTAKPGEAIVLDARASRDPDGDALSFEWMVYREAGSFDGAVTIENATLSLARFVAPRVAKPSEVHVILTVRDNGTPPLRAYQRVIVTIEP